MVIAVSVTVCIEFSANLVALPRLLGASHYRNLFSRSCSIPKISTNLSCVSAAFFVADVADWLTFFFKDLAKMGWSDLRIRQRE